MGAVTHVQRAFVVAISAFELANAKFWLSQRTPLQYAPTVVPIAGSARGIDEQRSRAGHSVGIAIEVVPRKPGLKSLQPAAGRLPTR